MNKPRVLVLDIETSPIISYTWGLFDQNIGLNQIKQDWNVLSFAAKWLGDPPSKVIYMDQSKEKDVHNDKKLLEAVWKLLDECDIVVTQNGKKFDIKKLNARFVLNKMQPPSSFKQIDTLVIARKMFGLTSNKLEFMTDKLCTKYKKQKHSEFGGFELWKGCLAGDKKAWAAMKKYNIYDILSLEELYNVLIPWDSSINFNLYHDELVNECKCGGKYRNKGYVYTATGKFSRHRCLKCGNEVKGRVNLFSKDKRNSLKMKPPR